MKRIIKVINSSFYLFLICYTIIFSTISINRYWQYEVFYYDFGIFERAIYLMSQFKPPIIEHYVFGGKLSFADHFNPSLILIALIYKFLPRQEFLLFIQVLFISLSGLVLYRLSLTYTKDYLFSFFISFSYLFFVGIQNALITDFHAVVLANLFFALFVYFYIKERFWPFILSYIIFLGFKENLFIIGSLTLVSLYLVKKQWHKKLFSIILASLIYGYTTIQIIIPHLSGREYYYTPVLPKNILEIPFRFFSNGIKIKTLFISFATFFFFPLLNFFFYLPLLTDLFIRFVPSKPTGMWDLGMHYNATTAVILAVSSIFFYPFFKKYLPQTKIRNSFLCFLFLISLFVNIKQYPPILLGINQNFYRHSKNFEFLNTIIRRIDQSCSVMSQNNILPHINHNKQIYLLRENYQQLKPDLIVLDIRKGQNPNNFWNFTEEKAENFLKLINKDKDYKLAYHTKEQFVFVRKGKENCFLK